MAPEPVRRPWKSDPTITLQFFVSWIMEIVVSQLPYNKTGVLTLVRIPWGT